MKLMGYCYERDHRKMIYMCKGSLDALLIGKAQYCTYCAIDKYLNREKKMSRFADAMNELTLTICELAYRK